MQQNFNSNKVYISYYKDHYNLEFSRVCQCITEKILLKINHKFLHLRNRAAGYYQTIGKKRGLSLFLESDQKFLLERSEIKS